MFVHVLVYVFIHALFLEYVLVHLMVGTQRFFKVHSVVPILVQATILISATNYNHHVHHRFYHHVHHTALNCEILTRVSTGDFSAGSLITGSLRTGTLDLTIM